MLPVSRGCPNVSADLSARAAQVKRKKLSLDTLRSWEDQGYTPKVREFTKQLEFDPEAVIDFCGFVQGMFSASDGIQILGSSLPLKR